MLQTQSYDMLPWVFQEYYLSYPDRQQMYGPGYAYGKIS